MEPIIGLDLKNFQSFKDTQLNLDPGLNVLVGPSNLGKSAAIRALKALVYNAPATGLVREGAKQFEVTTWFGDGQRIELIKGKNVSEFIWNDQTYAKSGANEAPDVVKEHWQIASNKLSFASQHEPPFLLAEPASAVAKVIGDLTNASMLMEAVGSCNKQRTSANNDAKARHREADEAREEILSHAGLTARGKALEAAREAFSATQELAQRWQSLVHLQEAHSVLTEKKAELTLLTESSVSFDNLIAQAEQSAATLTSLTELSSQYHKLISDKAAAVMDRQFGEGNLETSEKEIQQLLDEAGICPVCERPVNE